MTTPPSDHPTPDCHMQTAILDSIADGVFTVDSEWRITSFNRAAEQITQFPREAAIGKFCYEVFRASICQTACALRRTVETGQPLVNVRIDILRRDGQKVPISISTATFSDAHGQRTGGVETFRDLSLIEELKREIDSRHELGDIVGKHPRLAEVLEILPAVAHSDATVLIEGPSGSGKGLIASAIHSLSPRRDGRFIKVSCAALPETLLESELFGYVKGAFTDARRDKPGRIALAEGGTVFLDEIGDVSPAMQVKLLRVVQDHEYEPLGSSETISADVRVIAATNRDLRALISEGRFREDLFYRLAVVRLRIPPLKERREDIPLLLERFVSRFAQRTGKPITGVSEEAMQVLLGHDYPGNVRELENAIEHAFVLCHGGEIRPEHLPREAVEGSANSGSEPRALGLRESAEAEVIRRTLERHQGNRVAAAQELRMHRSTLWRKLHQYGLA
ncbi:MAG TPA: sigma 54-interacting transcriptional regulator [Polyangia bacterium]|jgi:PAS domain S-box-containing protein